MKFSITQYAHAWHASLHAAPTASWDDVSDRFLDYLKQHGLMKQLPTIQRVMHNLERKKKGVVQVCVRSAHNLNEEVIRSSIRQVLGDAHVELVQIHDPSLIGGIYIETENQRWNLSLANELRQLKKFLT